MDTLHLITLNASDTQNMPPMSANDTLDLLATSFITHHVSEKNFGSNILISTAITLLLLLLGSNVPFVAGKLPSWNRKPKAESQHVYRYWHWEPLFGLDWILKSTKALLKGNYLDMTMKIIQRDGGPVNTLVYLFFGKDAIVTMEPENIKALLSTNFQQFIHGKDRTQAMQPLFGHGIFNSNGATWKYSRSRMRPHVSRKAESDLDIFETHFANLQLHIPEDGATVDLQPLFAHFILDIVTDIFIGRSTNVLSQSTNNERGRKFANAHTTAQRELLIGDLSITELIKSVFGHADRNRSAREANELLYEMIEEAATRILSRSQDEGSEHSYFIETALREGRSLDAMKWDLMNLITAGKDTTSAVLGSVWFALARDPEVFRELQEEVATLGGQLPTLAQISQLKYLKLVIDETLRLYPPVPINMREAAVDTFLPLGGGVDGQSPLFVAKGCSVGYSVYGLHRRQDIWGADADEFRPERWVGLKKRSWEFIPFNGGPRFCLGQTFALNLVSYAVIRMVQNVSYIEARDDQPWTEALGLTTFSRNGVKVSIR